MKKIFTLVAAAVFALGANAQSETETWDAVTSDGTPQSVFGTTDNWADDTTFTPTTNVTVRLVAGHEVKATATPGLTAETWDSLGAPEYKVEKLHIDTYDDSGTEVGPDFYAAHGQGVPAANFIAEAWVDGDGNAVTDDNGNQLYRVPQQESDGTTAGYVYYEPDGSNGAPAAGFFFDLTAKVDGTFKVGFWANKGGGRALYIVDMDTNLALNPFGDDPDYYASGYIQNYRDDNGSLIWMDTLTIDSTYQIATASFETGDTVYNDDTGEYEAEVFNAQNQRKVGYLHFNATAGKTYRILGRNWQVGFNGYEFTPGTTGITTIQQDKAFDANAPKYSLSGQRVGDSYHGVVIQNGKKFIQ